MSSRKTLLMLTALISLACVTVSTLVAQEPQNEHVASIEKFEKGFAAGVRFKGDPAQTIQQRMAHFGVPGACIAVVKDNKVIWSKGYGVMDRKTGQQVSADTLFQCASISKPVSAAAALKMVEQGKFDLDTDINQYLKSWSLPTNEFTQQQPVTLKHLVSHTGGLTVHGFLGYTDKQKIPTLVQILDGAPPSNSGPIRVDKTPDGSMRYSGGGYCVMQQMMIDAYDGKSFPEIMDMLVLAPLEMNLSTFQHPLPKERLAEVATGYLPDGKRVAGGQHVYPEMAPAGLYASASQLASFFIELQLAKKGESERVLSRAMAKKMLTPVDGRFGLGVGVKDNAGELYMGHGGWNEGFSSEATFHQDRGYGVVVLTNSNHPPFVEEATHAVARTYKWHNYALPEFEKMPISDEQVEKLVGRYDHSGNLLKIYGSDDGLMMEASGSEPIQLYYVGGDQFACRSMDDLICFSPQGASFKKPWDQKVAASNTARRMLDDEKLPVEWLLAGDFDAALAGYQKLKNANPDSTTINEDRLNTFGYQLLGNGQKEEALSVFRINAILYPKAFNAFDSLGEMYLLMGQEDLGIQNYEKSLELNPGNVNATDALKRLKNAAGK